MDPFCKNVPKAELHIHLEGSLEPEMMLAMARRNEVSIPYGDVASIRAEYSFGSLAAFLRIYYAGMSVLCKPVDFYELTLAYLTRAHDQGVLHAELFFDPQAHRDKGLAFADLLSPIEDACAEALRRWNLTTKLIPNILRDRPVEEAQALVDEMVLFAGRIAGVGLDSNERDFPPSLFQKPFAKVRAAGLKTVAHAGEEGPARFIIEALDLLGVSRIDHGVRAIEDEHLVKRLASEGVPLTVCPISNAKLGVYPDPRTNSLPRLLRAGVKASIHSDDPAYMDAYIGDNYEYAQRELGLTPKELELAAHHSIESSFLDQVSKARLLDRLRSFVRGDDSP